MQPCILMAIVALAAPIRATCQEPQSDLILAVQDSIDRGVPGAEDRFWARTKASGTPFVEPLSGDSSKALVTFVFRAPSDVMNAVVITPLSLIDISNSRLALIRGSSIWYRSFEIPRDARFTYRFGTNDPLIPFERDTAIVERMRAWSPDAFNRQPVYVGMGITASLVQLDRAPGRLVPLGPEAGRAEMDSLLVNGVRRPVTFYRSPRYQEGRDDRLLVFTDGDAYTGLIPGPQILDELVSSGRISPVAAVFIGASPNDRTAEYDCNKTFSASLMTVVVPEARRRLHQSEESGVTLVGFSLGGLAAACAALDFPFHVSGLITQSGSFYRGDTYPEFVARRLAARPPLSIRWFIDIGTLETAPVPSRDPSMLTANRHLRDILQAKGYTLRYTESAHGHEHVAWRATLPEAIEWMYSVR